MTRSVTAFILAWTLLLSMAVSSTAEKAEKGIPIIKIQEPSYDWGEVPKGEVVRHTYAVLNEGTAPLKIAKIYSD